jgi:uncharacterized protein
VNLLKPLTTRRKALGLLTAGAAGCLLEAFVLEPKRLSVTRRDIPVPDLPAGLDGLRVGLMSDFHFRPGDDDALVSHAVARASAENLDLIALTGDYMSNDPKVISPMLEILGGLTARHGVFAVAGNHDGWRGNVPGIRRQFESAGFSFLRNRNTRLHHDGATLAIAGTDFVWKGAPDPAATFKGIPATTPVLALVHEPDYFDTLRARRPIALQLSGHTHGGQCRVPVIGYAPRKVDFGRIYIDGHHARGDSNLFVTRGIGTVGPRVRFACPPQLVILTLRSSPTAT